MVADRQRARAGPRRRARRRPGRAAGPAASAALSDADRPGDRRGAPAALVNGLLHLFGQPTPLDGIDPARARRSWSGPCSPCLGGAGPRGPGDRRRSPTSHWAEPAGAGPARAHALARSGRDAVRAHHHGPPGRRAAARRRARRATRAVRCASTPLDPAAAGELAAGHARRRGRRRALHDELLEPQRRQPAVPEELAALVGRRRRARSSCPTRCGASWPPASTSCRSTSGDARQRRRARVRPGSYGSAGRVRPGAAARTSAARSLLTPWPTPGCSRSRASWWRFRSASVREVAYHTITKADRARRHVGVAKAMVDETHKAEPARRARSPLGDGGRAGRGARSAPAGRPPRRGRRRRCRRCWRQPPTTSTASTPARPSSRWRGRSRSATASSTGPRAGRWC